MGSCGVECIRCPADLQHPFRGNPTADPPDVLYDSSSMAKKRSNRKKSFDDTQLIDAGGGGSMGGNPGGFMGATRPDLRGGSGLGFDFPDPIQRPRKDVVVVRLPGTRQIVYVPVPVKPPKKKMGNRGGGGAAGVE